MTASKCEMKTIFMATAFCHGMLVSRTLSVSQVFQPEWISLEWLTHDRLHLGNVEWVTVAFLRISSASPAGSSRRNESLAARNRSQQRTPPAALCGWSASLAAELCGPFGQATGGEGRLNRPRFLLLSFASGGASPPGSVAKHDRNSSSLVGCFRVFDRKSSTAGSCATVSREGVFLLLHLTAKPVFNRADCP